LLHVASMHDRCIYAEELRFTLSLHAEELRFTLSLHAEELPFLLTY
jgi:hypothetical protein